MQETHSNQMVELIEDTDVQIDRRDGDTVTLFAGTYLNVLCTMLPGVIQVDVLDGDYADRIAFIPREAEFKQ